MKYLILNVNGVIEYIDGPSEDSLKWLQEKVGGYIEGLSLNGTAYAYINKQGKMERLPINKIATLLMHTIAVGNGLPFWEDCIMGNMVISGNADNVGKDTEVPVEFARAVQELGLNFHRVRAVDAKENQIRKVAAALNLEVTKRITSGDDHFKHFATFELSGDSEAIYKAANQIHEGAVEVCSVKSHKDFKKPYLRIESVWCDVTG